MKAFTANFDETSVNSVSFDFDDIDDLVNRVDQILEILDDDFDPLDIVIEMNPVEIGDDGVMKFLSEWDELNYDMMVEIGDGVFDEFWEDGGSKYYQYQFLVFNNALSAEDAIDKCDNVQVFHGSRADYAKQYIDDCYEIPTNLINYIDYDSFANDLEREGELTEFKDDVWIVNANSF